MEAHRGGALCLGQGPSLSPQGPHTATPSLPLWHPSSTGESLGMGVTGMGEHGAGGALGCGAVGGMATAGGRQAQQVAMENAGVESGGSVPKGRFPLDLSCWGS